MKKNDKSLKKSWNRIVSIVCTGSRDKVKKLACPECGSPLKVEYGEYYSRLSKRMTSYLTVQCLSCMNGMTSDGEPNPPPWTKEGSNRLITSQES